MDDKELLQLCKTSLRIVTDAYDDTEIIPLISAAEDDISASCNKPFDIKSPVECRLVVLYVRANFGSGDGQSWQLYQQILKTVGIRKQG